MALRCSADAVGSSEPFDDIGDTNRAAADVCFKPTVWASVPPSVKTLATPSDVPRSKPSTYLRAKHRGFAWFTHTYEREFARAVFQQTVHGADKAYRDSNRNRRLAVATAARTTATIRASSASSLLS